MTVSSPQENGTGQNGPLPDDEIPAHILAEGRSRFSAREILVERALPGILDRVDVDVRTEDGVSLRTTPAPAHLPRIVVHNPQALKRRLAHHPKIGIGESYMAGEWDTAEGTDLCEALTPFAQAMTTAIPRWMHRLRRIVDRPIPHFMRNSPDGSRRNIAAHYDLSNELFALFLDETMTYSSALFEHGIPMRDQDLHAAQLRKIDAALDRARVGAGTRLLEIGTGWGALAIRAAERGAEVTSITLSTEQRELALRRVAEAGLNDRVDIRIEDYREVRGEYDAVVSIEMIEAVGEEFWPAYFSAIDERLARGGTAVVQAILMEDDRLQATRRSFGWIQKYIFPGGLIPSMEAIKRATDEHTRLQVTEVSRFGLSYAETLRRWRKRFDERCDDVRRLGFDDRFIRAWRFYLAYSEAGFRSQYLDVAQIRLQRPGE